MLERYSVIETTFLDAHTCENILHYLINKDHHLAL